MFHKRLVSEFQGLKKTVAGIVICQWIAMIANIVFVFATVNLCSEMMQQSLERGEMITYIVIVLITVMVRCLTVTIANRLSFQASTTVKEQLRKKVFRKLIELGSRSEERRVGKEC